MYEKYTSHAPSIEGICDKDISGKFLKLRCASVWSVLLSLKGAVLI